MSRPKPRTGPRTLLVVDSTSFYREMVVEVLSKLGHHAEGCERGQTALDLLASGPRPDLILLDASLEDMSSLSFLNQVQASRRPVPVLVLSSSYLDDTEIQRLKQMGAVGCAAKGAPIEELLIGVEAILFPEERNARRSPRAQASLPVSYQEGERRVGSHSFNLSADGMFVVTTSEPPLPPGSRIELTFWLPNAPELIQCEGVVIWCNNRGERLNELYPPGMGIMFRGLSAETTALINSYVLERAANPFR